MTKAEEVKLEIESRIEKSLSYIQLDFLYEDYGQIKEYEQVGDQRRWQTGVSTFWIFEDGSILGIDWDRANTENQDSDGPHSIYLAESYQVVTTKYRRINV